MIDRISAFMHANQVGLAILGAAIVKVILSERLGWRAVTGTIFVAVFAAWLLTPPVTEYFSISESYKTAVAALIALVGEQIARALVLISNDPDFLRDIVKSRLGGGRK